MLLKIREKAQGVFAWVILILICVPFALWGIQNYLDVGKETPVAKVGDREFFQRDVNKAYAQYAENMAGVDIDEDELKKLALEKLVRDEVLLQYVQKQGLVATDETTRQFIGGLEYFQTDGRFDKKQYKTLLRAQNLSSAEFEARIRKALIMEQFQRSLIQSGFATQFEVDNFFRIQNQTRNVEFTVIPLIKPDSEPTAEQIEAYYLQHRDGFQSPEQVSIEYLELSVDELAKKQEPTEQELRDFYLEQKDAFTTPERRRIGHILFANNEQGLADARKAMERLKTEDFAKLAEELSLDATSAKKGGDLGVIPPGAMEKTFEDATFALKKGEVSEPVKTAFGYHLIKVTELTEGSVKPFEDVRDVVKLAYQKAEVENTYYQMGETLTELSYEHPDNLEAAAQALNMEIKKTGFFTRHRGEGIAVEKAVRDAAFSEDVLGGNNSEPLELGADRVVVLRMLEHRPAVVQELEEVKPSVIEALLDEESKSKAIEKAGRIRKLLVEGSSLKDLAEDENLEVETYSSLSRSSGDIAWEINRAIFKAAKPKAEKPTVISMGLPSGEQVVINLLGVSEGGSEAVGKEERKQVEANIARAYGQMDFNAVLSALQEKADITIRKRSDN
ncbi:MAG: SurA N-terminal domain-containing protein [Gammaproteobacteria bacterium]